MNEGDTVTLLPFEDQPKQLAEVVSVDQESQTAIVVLLGLQSTPEDDLYREVPLSQISEDNQL